MRPMVMTLINVAAVYFVAVGSALSNSPITVESVAKSIRDHNSTIFIYQCDGPDGREIFHNAIGDDYIYFMLVGKNHIVSAFGNAKIKEGKLEDADFSGTESGRALFLDWTYNALENEKFMAVFPDRIESVMSIGIGTKCKCSTAQRCHHK